MINCQRLYDNKKDFACYYRGTYEIMLIFLWNNFIESASIISNELILHVALVMYLVIVNQYL